MPLPLIGQFCFLNSPSPTIAPSPTRSFDDRSSWLAFGCGVVFNFEWPTFKIEFGFSSLTLSVPVRCPVEALVEGAVFLVSLFFFAGSSTCASCDDDEISESDANDTGITTCFSRFLGSP